MTFKNYFTPAPRGFHGILISILVLSQLSIAAPNQNRRRPQADLGLKITLPAGKFPDSPVSIFESKTTLRLIRRDSLDIIDHQTAGDFTAIEIQAQKLDNAIKVRLAIVYNDLSDESWRKNRKERLVGTYLIPEGESVRPPELAQFGIEPFEMSAISAKPVPLQPGEGPQIINNTTALEVVSLKKSLDSYCMTLKNISGKNIVGYALSYAGAGSEIRSSDYGAQRLVIPAGELYEDVVYHPYIESEGITIRAVFFDDGTFDGDRQRGLIFQARREGVRIQAPYVLRMIEQTLEAPDAELERAFYKLEAGLWKIPEAIDKKSALELLKTSYPSLNDEGLSSLYERLKEGLYEARNLALFPLGDLKREREEAKKRDVGNGDEIQASSYIRSRLTELKETFENLVSKL